MVLETIIELENRIIKSKKSLPKRIKLSYQHYCVLIKELEATRYINELHGLPIVVIPLNRIIVE